MAVSIVEAMYTRSAPLTRRLVIDVMLAPLLRCSTSNSAAGCRSDNAIVVSEIELDATVDIAHKVILLRALHAGLEVLFAHTKSPCILLACGL